jgi:hypothetical protein
MPNIPYAQVLFECTGGSLGDEAQVKAHFGLFGDSANLDAI